MIRILLVDDHAVVRTGIKLMLKDALDIEVIGEAPNGEDAIQLARELKPDVVLMDINMPGIGGLEATLRILRNDTSIKVLIISTHDDDILPARFMSLGASGYLNKRASQSDLIRAIQSIHAGNYYVDPAVLSHTIMQKPPTEDTAQLEQLSERELQILLMVARGIEVSDIAKKLYVSAKTINGYRNSILRKLVVKNTSRPLRIAIIHGLIDVDSQWH